MNDDITARVIAWVLVVIAVVVAVFAVTDDDPPPTTTTGPPTTSTTTTEPPTTSSSTTTTVDPTTTTGPPDELPAAIDCRAERLPRYDIISSNGDTGGDTWLVSQYCADLPYESFLDVDGEAHPRYSWPNDLGDRMGYFGAYGFSVDHFLDDEIQSRVTYVQTSGGGYAKVNDRHLVEGTHTYAGFPSLVGGREIGDLPHPAEGDYSPEACIGEAPVVAIMHDHHIIDIRDFRDTDAPEHIDFCLLEHVREPFETAGEGRKAPTCPPPEPGWGCEPHTVYERVTVGFVVEVDGKPVIPEVAYYDSLVPATYFLVR